MGNPPVTCNFDKCAGRSAWVVRSAHPRTQRHRCLAVDGFVIEGRVEDALAGQQHREHQSGGLGCVLDPGTSGSRGG
jgi:hypothetical protein